MPWVINQRQYFIWFHVLILIGIDKLRTNLINYLKLRFNPCSLAVPLINLNQIQENEHQLAVEQDNQARERTVTINISNCVQLLICFRFLAKLFYYRHRLPARQRWSKLFMDAFVANKNWHINKNGAAYIWLVCKFVIDYNENLTWCDNDDDLFDKIILAISFECFFTSNRILFF